jgi:hypothetical protein
VVFDAHRSDDDRPYVYVSEDFGQTWKPLHGSLPQWGSTRVLREDLINPNLLYLGTEFALWCSLDRGQSWVKLNNNLPTVAVHEVAIHPTAGEIVAATHGRGLWILDVTALRQLSHKTLSNATLLKPATVTRYRTTPTRGRTLRRFVGENPPRGATLAYTLPEKPKKITLKVTDEKGKLLRELKPASEVGLNQVVWDTLGTPAARPRQGQPARASSPTPAGTYRVVLDVDGVEQAQTLKIENDPNAAPGGRAEEEPGVDD